MGLFCSCRGCWAFSERFNSLVKKEKKRFNINLTRRRRSRSKTSFVFGRPWKTRGCFTNSLVILDTMSPVLMTTQIWKNFKIASLLQMYNFLSGGLQMVKFCKVVLQTRLARLINMSFQKAMDTIINGKYVHFKVRYFFINRPGVVGAVLQSPP